MTSGTKLKAITLAVLLLFLYFGKRFYGQLPASSTHDRGAFDIEKQDCCLLFAKPPYDRFNLSETYFKRLDEFRAEARKYLPKRRFVDEHFHILKKKILALHYTARWPFVKTVCETGFKFGDSSFTYLTAKSSSVVYSFDPGHNPYTNLMYKKLQEMFPDRLHLELGDSMVSIPKFIKENPNLKCDMVLIGRVNSYEEVRADLNHFIKVVNKKNNIIFMDNHPATGYEKYGKAWDDLVTKGVVKEIFRCNIFGESGGFLAGFAE